MNESGSPRLVDDLAFGFETVGIVLHLSTRTALALPDIRGEDLLCEGIIVIEREVRV